MTDAELLDRVRAGDVDVFGTLIERYQRQLYYFVIGKVSEHTEAQDIVQKSFVTAYRSLDTFKTGSEFFPWIKGIALNHCRNEWRRHRSQATMKERLLEARRAELELLWLAEEQRPGEARVAALRQCLQQLTPQEQVLIDRRFVQELSMDEIGRELSKGGEAIRLWLYRLRVRLADCVRKRLALTDNLELG
jgi:RNA polymerase sigma-70 factor (ECF subfamily)